MNPAGHQSDPDDEWPDEFGPYLDDAMTDPEFRDTYWRVSERSHFEDRLADERWPRFRWRWLATRAALADKITAERVWTVGKLTAQENAARLAREIKGRIPW